MKFAKILIIIAVVVAAAGAIYFTAFSKPKGRDVVLIILDTTRADHLGAYGYERPTSPNLDAFAAESTLFESCIAPAPWTPLSIGSIMTGLYVSSHSFVPPNDRQLAKKTSAKLDEKLVTLAEMLKAHGYKTAGVTPNPWTSKLFGFDQGFEQYFFRERARAEEINRAGFQIMDDWKKDSRPGFLFLHYLDPHDPYEAPAPYSTQFSGALQKRKYPEAAYKDINAYDGEIAYLDHHLGELFAKFKENGIYDNALIIVVADHGEQFTERGHTGHGFLLYDEEIHIPLIIHDSKRPPGKVDYTVTNVDIYPTVMEAVGIPVGDFLQGVPLFQEDKLLARPGVLSEIDRKYNQKSFTTLERKKLMIDYADGMKDAPEGRAPVEKGLYDSQTDPFELQPLNDAALQKSIRAHFDDLYSRVVANKISAGEVEIGEHTLDTLKSMGYMK